MRSGHCSGARTAVGNFGGSLKDVLLVKMGAVVIREVLKKVGLEPMIKKEVLELGPDLFEKRGDLTELEKSYAQWEGAGQEVQVDEVIMGNVLQAGQGQNPARQAMIYGGIPKETTSLLLITLRIRD
jgi:acetyl-CoA C-acetyltransferase